MKIISRSAKQQPRKEDVSLAQEGLPVFRCFSIPKKGGKEVTAASPPLFLGATIRTLVLEYHKARKAVVTVGYRSRDSEDWLQQQAGNNNTAYSFQVDIR